jgi:uncharacterized protein
MNPQRGRRLTDLGAAIGIGLIAAVLGARTGLPGAPIVLPIIVVGVWHLTLGNPSARLPSWLQVVAFGLLGTTIGLSLDRNSLETLRAGWPLLLVMALAVYVAAALVMVVIARVANIDITTALLAGSPGGFTAISAVSLSAGANVAQVVAVQTLRVMIIYASLPGLIAFLKHFR